MLLEHKTVNANRQKTPGNPIRRFGNGSLLMFYGK